MARRSECDRPDPKVVACVNSTLVVATIALRRRSFIPHPWAALLVERAIAQQERVVEALIRSCALSLHLPRGSLQSSTWPQILCPRAQQVPAAHERKPTRPQLPALSSVHATDSEAAGVEPVHMKCAGCTGSSGLMSKGTSTESAGPSPSVDTWCHQNLPAHHSHEIASSSSSLQRAPAPSSGSGG